MAVDLSMPVLVVDDYSTMSASSAIFCGSSASRTSTKPPTAAALAKLRDKHYGLVISDWNMEPMTGYELLKQVRADPQSGADAVHHGHGRIQDRERDRGEAGRRDNYIVKPFNAETLKSKIDSVFADRRISAYQRLGASRHYQA